MRLVMSSVARSGVHAEMLFVLHRESYFHLAESRSIGPMSRPHDR